MRTKTAPNALGIDYVGELRSAIAKVSTEEYQWMPDVVFLVCMASTSMKDPGLRDALVTMARDTIGDASSGRASVWSRIEFALEATPALALRIGEEAPWVLSPERAAAAWLAGLAWQTTAHYPNPPMDQCIHVYMGLGGNKELRLLWCLETVGWFRYVTIGEGNGGIGNLLMHAAMQGFPGFSKNLGFDTSHIDLERMPTRPE